MNRSELVRAVAERAGSDEAAARRHVDAVFDAVMERVSAGERVIVTGFGTFDRLARPARTARNPRTGVPVEVPAAQVPRFRSGQTFRTRVAADTAPEVQAAAEPEAVVTVAVEPSRPKKPKSDKNGGKKSKKGADAKKDAKKKARDKAAVPAAKNAKNSKKKPGKAKARAKSGK